MVSLTVVLQLVLPLLAVAAMWGSLTNKLSQISDSQKKVEAKQEEHGKSIHGIELQMSKIQGRMDAEDNSAKAPSRPLATIPAKS